MNWQLVSVVLAVLLVIALGTINVIWSSRSVDCSSAKTKISVAANELFKMHSKLHAITNDLKEAMKLLGDDENEHSSN